MNKNEIVATALSNFYRSEKGGKIRNAVRTIVSQLEKCSTKELEKMVELIAIAIKRESFNEANELRENFFQRTQFLGLAVAEHIFKVSDVPFICRNFFDHRIYPDDDVSGQIVGRQFLLGRLYVHIGSSLDCSLRFCRLMFGYLAKLEEKRVMKAGAEAEDPFEFTVLRTIVNSLSVPDLEDAPQKLWVYNLIEAADRGNEEAAEFFKAASYHCLHARFALTGSTDHVGSTIISQSEFDSICPDKMEQLKIDYSKLQIVIPDRLKDKTIRLGNNIANKADELRNEATSFLGWFTEHGSRIGARFDEMGNTILTGARYGVRPMGFDSFIVNVSALRSIGVTSFSFYPEGEMFPNLKVSVVVRKPGFGLCELWMRLENFELKAIDDIFQNWQGFDVPLLRSVLEYIVVDALHRIVIPRPKKDLDEEEVERTIMDVTPSARVRVRPFIRRLPIGFSASDESRKLAFIQMGWILLEGMTFVKAHDRWVDLPAGKPAPLFKYTDESIRKSIE